MEIIVLNTSRYGGISDYLHSQANAMSALGAKVTMVGVEGTQTNTERNYEFIAFWKEPTIYKNRVLRRMLFCSNLLSNTHRFANFLKTRPERFVLFGGFFEYLAPFWARKYRAISNQKKIGTIIHDPIRDYVVGPTWWHKRSIASAYSFNDVGFVHGSIDAVKDAGDTKLVSIPIGPFPFPPHHQTGKQLRDAMGIPESATVVLSFGHIRDGKNLNLIIEAMVAHPNVHLVVAGAAQSSGQKPAQFYLNLAKELGVADRCHFEVRFIKDDEVGSFHDAADVIALTYSSDFHSASAALGTCIHYRKPCIASSGSGPLQDTIEEYELGNWVPPDSTEMIQSGLSKLLATPMNPKWDRFESENSWERNASLVLDAFNEIDKG